MVAIAPVMTASALALSASWDEEKVVAAFLTKSPMVKANRVALQMAQADGVAAGLLANPVLEVGREQIFSPGGPAEQHRMSVSVPWNVANKLEWRVAIARSGVKAAQAHVAHQLFLMTQDVRSTYVRAHFTESKRNVLQEHMQTLARLKRVLTLRTQNGETAGSDLLLFQLAHMALEARVVQARTDAIESRARLSGLLGQTLTGSLCPTQAIPVIPEATALLERAMRGRQDLLALRLERERAAQSLQLADTGRFPDPAIALGLKQTNEPTVQGLGYSAGLAWPMPVFNRGQGEQALAEAAQAGLDSRIEALRSRLRTELPEARRAYAERVAAAQTFDRQLENRAQVLLKSAERAYQEGEQGVRALLDAHQTVLDCRLQGLDLVLGACLARLDLERLMGYRLGDR